jgi:radical SAM C-methyltransferase
MRKLRVALIHQGIWDMDKLSMPLACGYLKAFAMSNEALRSDTEIRIFNYGGAAKLSKIAPEVVLGYQPDILAASIFGWSHNLFGRLAETFKQVNPRGWCVFGGTHVANQAEREFRLFPGVDVIVNGEGEITFSNLLAAFLASASKHELSHIRGISYRAPDNSVLTTEPEPRIRNLDDIPSPFLSGAIPMLDDRGECLYDAVTMETNRGCPYSCSFCYWGGAVGQKLHSFSHERLREELEFFGRHKIENICLCDANFGMTQADEDYLDSLLEVRSRYGYPRNLVSSWAKNKGKRFFSIARKMKSSGLQSDFTVSLQSLDPHVLELARRKNMRVNEFDDLCQWILDEGFEAYGELIWGLPGETYDSFLSGYDRLAKYVPRIATYSNILIPNTEYHTNRQKYGFTTLRGEEYDFEYILSHNSMSYQDNRRMHRFLFLSRLISEHMLLRFAWAPLSALTGLTQSQVLLDLDAWMHGQNDEVTQRMKEYQHAAVEYLDSTRVSSALRYIYQEPQTDEMFVRWWDESIVPRFSDDLKDFARELIRYEILARPMHDERAKGAGMKTRRIHGEQFYIREDLRFAFDIPATAARFRRGESQPIVKRPFETTWYYKQGFSRHIDNHEVVIQYSGQSEEALDAEQQLRQIAGVREKQRHVVGLPERV